MSNRFTEYAAESLDNAMRLSKELRSGFVGGAHLLLGMMQCEDSSGGRLLQECGYSYSTLLDTLR